MLDFWNKILNIQGWMGDAELFWLFDTVTNLQENSVIVEIGAWKGRSTAALFGAAKNKTVITIDTWLGQVGEILHKEALSKSLLSVFLSNMWSLGFRVKAFEGKFNGLYYLRDNSLSAVNYFNEGSIDMLFIDGDHTKVNKEIEVWSSKIKKGGIMCGHDYRAGWQGIDTAVDSIFTDKVISRGFIWSVTL